ncbi:MAG: SPOR domain-containing protein [Rhodomicrobium sp.]
MQASGIIRLSAVFGLSLAVLIWAPGGIPAALAESSDPLGIEMLSQALKAYESGDYNTASVSLDRAFQAGLSKELSARAILLRAQINERSGALARALQDYSNALWMDALPPAERKRAADGKQRVLAAMGLSGAAPAAPAGPGGVKPARTQGAAGSSVAQAAPENSSESVFGMFNGIFASQKETPPSPPPPPPANAPVASWQTATAPSPAPAASASPVLSRAKEADTGADKAAPPLKVAQARQPVQPPIRIASIQPVSVSSAPAANGFLILFGSAGSEAAARTKARQIKAALADILISRELDIEAGNDGGFQIMAGPYKAKAAALALCAAMKQRGVACQVSP